MGLSIKPNRIIKRIVTLTAVMALVAQPMYGLIAGQVSHAVDNSSAITKVDAYYTSGTGYTGIGVDFNLKNVKNATGVKIILHGGPTNYSISAKQNLINAINESPTSEYGTSGTVVITGSRVSSSNSWEAMTGTWTGSSRPVSAQVLVTQENGPTLDVADTTIVNNSGNSQASVFASVPDLSFVANYINNAAYGGVSLEIRTPNLTTGTGIEIAVNRTNGNPDVWTNKPGAVMGALNSGNHTTTAPIVIAEKSRTRASSSSWQTTGSAWTNNQEPISVTVRVTLSNGGVIEKTVPLGSVWGVAWSEISALLPSANTAPIVTVSTPAESGVVSTKNGNKLAIKGSFTDDTAVNYLQLELVKGGNLVTVETMHYNNAGLNADGSFVYNMSVPANIANGEYSLFYTGTDFENGVTTRTERKFTIDNTDPTIDVKLAPDTIGSVASNTFSKVSFKLHDNIKFEGKYTINGVESAITPSTWGDANYITVGQRGAVYGVNTITLKDLAGNSTSYTFVLDNVAPTITVKDGFVGNKDSKTFSNVSFSLYDVYKVDKYVINGHASDFTNNKWSDANFQNIKAHLIEGEVNTLALFDAAGNSNTYTFTYDSTKPTATFNYSNNNGSALTRDNVTVTMNTSEPIQTPAGWNQVNDQKFTRTYTDNGQHSVVLVDTAGNESLAQKYEVKRIDRQPPEITGVTDGATVRGSVTLAVTDPKYQGADGFDQNQGLKINGVAVATTPGSNKSYLYTLTKEGTYEVTATDKAGNVSTTLKFTIDNSILLTISPVTGTATIPVISGTARWASDGTPAEGKSVSVEVRKDDAVVRTLGPVQTNAAGEWSVQVAPTLGAGSYVAYAALGSVTSGEGIVGPVSISVKEPAPVSTGGPTSTPGLSSSTGAGIATVPSLAQQPLNANFTAVAATTPVLATTTPSSDDDEPEVRGLSTTSALSDDTSAQEGEVKAAEDSKPTWSLVNVVLGAAAVIMGLMALLGLFGKKEEGEESMNGRRVTAVVLGAGSVVALLFLENFSGSMSVVNIWTLGFAAIAIAQAAIIASLKRA